METKTVQRFGPGGPGSASSSLKVIRDAFHAVAMYLAAIPARIENSARAEQQIPHIPPLLHLFWALLFYVGGLGMGIWAATGDHWIVIPFCWVAIVHGARKLQVNIGHACSHGTLTGDPNKDRHIGIIIHALALATAFDVYAPAHRDEHHPWKKLATEADPTWQSLAAAGIKPGVSKSELYRRLWRACFSPSFHWRILRDRVSSHLQEPGTYRVYFLAGVALLATLLTAFHTWIPFAVAFVVPSVWGYQSSQLLRLCVEHRLPEDPNLPRSGYSLHELTDEYVLRLTSPIDMFMRITCMTGDTLRHALHHNHPTSMQWSDYISAGPRARAVAIAKGRVHQYNEIVGFRAAVNECFKAMSVAKVSQP